MSSSEETRIRDDLRRIVPTRAPSLDLDVIEQRGRREQQRVLALRGLAAVGVTGIAVAGSLVAFRHAGAGGAAPVAAPVAVAPTKTASGHQPGTTTPPQAPQLDNVAYVRQRISAAQDPANSVVEMKQSAVDADNPAETDWTDPVTSNVMERTVIDVGKIALWTHQYLDSHRVINVNFTQVNYDSRTWSFRTENLGAPITGPAPNAPALGVSYIPAASLKSMLPQGHVKIVGHPVVDGQRTVELSDSLGKAETMYFYVDSQTFRLVRLVRVFAPDSPVRRSATSDYTWVRRTPALTGLINHPQIPAGFTQVPPS
ncbi:MAG TPA: hypothetical protein VGG83_05385 [Trebonia sp.]|jgi:hypothetical protein